MNKVSLLTVGKKLQDGNLYVLSIYDLEPSGVQIHAYNQANSREYILPVSEFELSDAGYSRNSQSLNSLMDSIDIVSQGNEQVLQSSDEKLSNIKQRLFGPGLQEMLKSPLAEGTPSLNELVVTALVELCKAKPTGLDAVEWLGQWFLNNNPLKPNVESPDDE